MADQTHALITQYLYDNKIPYQEDSNTGTLLLSFGTKDGIFPMDISSHEQGRWIDIYVSKLLKVNESPYKGVIFQTLFVFQNENPLIRFMYNPKSGYINASIDITLVDMTITEKALLASIDLMVYAINRIMPRLKSILATGEDPGEKSFLASVIDYIPEETLEEIAQLINQRKGQKKSDI